MWEPFADVASIERIAETAQKAPSVFNTQPWSFRIVAADRIELRANLGERDGVDRGHWDRWLRSDIPHPNPLAREFAISCGAALFNLRLAIRVAAHDLAVWLLPDPEGDSALLASVEIVTGRIKKPTVEEQELFEAIWRRHTNRWPYTIIPAPMPIIVAMEGAAAREGAWLRLLHASEARSWMRLAAKADRDPAFRPPFPNYVSRSDYGPTPKNRHPRTRKDFWSAEHRRFERKPQLMALSTDDDQPLDWLRAGQALQRAILTGTRESVSAAYGLAARYHAPRRYGFPAQRHLLTRHDEIARYGLSVSFLTQALERADIAAKPRRWPWRWPFPELPQMVMRVGYARVPTPAVPRLQPDILDARPSGGPSGDRRPEGSLVHGDQHR
jgi:nitroreductase